MRLPLGVLLFTSGCCWSSPAPPARTAVTPPPPDPSAPVALPTCEGARCPILEADALVAAGRTVFLGARDRIVAIDDDATSTRFVSAASALHVSSLAASETHVYWTEQRFGAPGAVLRAPRGGGPAEPLHVLASFATQLAVDDLGVCWIAERRLECGAHDGSNVRTVFEPVTVFALAPVLEGPRAVFVQNDEVFAVVPRAGGEPLLREPLPEVMRPNAMALLVGDDGVYVAESTTRLSGSIARRALDGTGRVELAHGMWWPTALALLGDRVVGTANEVGLVSVPRAGGPATVPVPHGRFEVHRALGVTERHLWMIQGDPPAAYRIPRATLEDAATPPP